MTGLTYKVLDFADSSLNKTAVLISGEKDALVVDASFTRADGHRVVAEVLDSGKTLKAVLITAGDPDFYFGAEVIADAYPEVKFLAPADVIKHIKESYQKKLETWAHLGANLPTRLVEISQFEGEYDLEGHILQLRKASEELGDRGWYLWDAETRSITGGILLFDGLHVWTADTPTPESRNIWIKTLESLLILDPKFVVAGHRIAGSATDITPINYTRDYLLFFEKTIESSPDAKTAEKILLEKYPNAGMRVGLSLGTKVAKGEMEWK